MVISDERELKFKYREEDTGPVGQKTSDVFFAPAVPVRSIIADHLLV